MQNYNYKYYEPLEQMIAVRHQYMGKIIKEYAEKDPVKGVFTVSKANALKYAHDVMLTHMNVNAEDKAGDDQAYLHTYWAKEETNANFEKCW